MYYYSCFSVSSMASSNIQYTYYFNQLEPEFIYEYLVVISKGLYDLNFNFCFKNVELINVIIDVPNLHHYKALWII